jgi:hypothetical protein
MYESEEDGREEQEDGDECNKIEISNKAKKSKKKAKKSSDGVVMNIVNTKYEIVRHAGKELLGWRICRESPLSKNWDIYWTDSAIRTEFLASMERYQKVNHFPGSFV